MVEKVPVNHTEDVKSDFEMAMSTIADRFDPERARLEHELLKPFNSVTPEQIGRKLTPIEHALQRGIARNRNGEWLSAYWRQTNGDIMEDDECEPAPGFELDIEHPELTEKLESIADEKGLKAFKDDYCSGGLKMFILNHYDQLKDSSDKKWNTAFKILSETTAKWSGFNEAILLQKNDKQLEGVSQGIDEIYSAVNMKDKRSHEFAVDTASELARFYQGEDESFIQLIAERTKHAASTEDKRGDGYFEPNSGKGFLQITLEGISDLCESNCTDRAKEYYDFIDQISMENFPLGNSNLAKKDVFSNYVASLHGMSDTLIDGLKQNVYPMMSRNDPETIAICEANSWACEPGTYGISDYTIETLTTKNSPKNFNKMMRIHNELPTADFSRFEQNRIDAARLQGSIIGGRDFIHDERLGVNEILTAMLDYYEADGDDDSYKKLQDVISKYPNYGLGDKPFNLESYESVIEGRKNNRQSNAENYKNDEKAVDILRRLVENTKPVHLEAPKTRFESLNVALEKINPIINEQTGEVRIDLKEISDAISEMNKVLIGTQGQIGILPSTVDAACYLDKMSAYALRGVAKKDLSELAYEPVFKEILRFSQLTSSTEYDEHSFENFYNNFLQQCNGAFGPNAVDGDKIKEGYRQISQQVTNNSMTLAKEYVNGKHYEARFAGAVWSGNLSHELIGLFDR